MERILLYYPAINIPNGIWLRNSILYTDKVSSIFPFEDLKDVRVNDDTKFLYDEGLYKPIYVFKELRKEMDLKTKEFENFENNFLDTIKSEDFNHLRKKTEKYDQEKHKGFYEYGMYLGKLTSKVREYLSENKLFMEVNSNEAVVEYNSATLYMSMLANYLASINEFDIITPSTDDSKYESIAFKLADNKKRTYKIILERCLPAPKPNVSIKKIIKFKNKRRDELLNFRNEIDEIEKKIISSESVDENKLTMIKFKEKIEKETIELTKLFGDSRIGLLQNTLTSLVDFKSKDIAGTLGAMGLGGGGAELIATHPILGTAGIAVGGIILISTVISSYKKIKRQVESNSFSYVYSAKKYGILTF